jgi:hypothetical protein
LGPRIRAVKAKVDELAATQAALEFAGTPVIRLADEATVGRYVSRLQQTLSTGSANARRSILRAWVAKVEATGTTLKVTFTLPPEVGEGPDPEKATTKGQNPGLTEVLPHAKNGGGGGSRTRVRS